MISEKIYQLYLSLLLKGDRLGCRGIVQQLLNDKIQLKALYEQLFQRSLYDVGLLWETNKISVAIEHMCTSITENLISLSYPYMFTAEKVGRKAVITCTPGEFHQVGARMLADYFELNGWDSYFLGSNTPDTELVSFIKVHNPDLLAVSMSVFFNLKTLQSLVVDVHRHFPGLEIIVGGQGFNWGGADSFKASKKVSVLRSLDELDKKILNLTAHD